MGLNERQKDAVMTDGKELLVSASAGTGKTSTMCTRILHRITRKENPLSLDRLLIVTFTVASAADMRKKMGETLRAALKNEEDAKTKERIKQQLRLLPGAKICTIDSFCSDLVRRHFDVLGLSPRQRIPDKSELRRLKNRAMRRAIDACLSEDAEGFSELISSILPGYSDRDLPDKLCLWFTLLEVGTEGIGRLLTLADLADKEKDLPYERSRAGAYISEHNARSIRFFIKEYEMYRSFLAGLCYEDKKEDAKRLAQIAICDEDLLFLHEMLALVSDPAKFYERYKSHVWKNMATMTAVENLRFKTMRKHLKELFDDRKTAYNDFSFEEREETLRCEAMLLRRLHALLDKYKDELEARKKALSITEFSDIEKQTVRLLYGDAEHLQRGERSEFARLLSEEFDEIYVDEYQDVNALQNSIFASLSRGNRYMVGDIKQSIYSFRGACPDAFNALRESYPPLEKDQSCARIFFSENYRCDKEVVDFVNAVCSRLLSLCDDMHYYPDDDLICAKEQKEPGMKPTFCLLTPDQRLIDPAEVENVEAAYVAECVKNMIKAGTPGEDITILCGKMTGAAVLRRAFDRVGVPLDLTTHRGFFEHPEVAVLRNVLEMINNPTLDVSLAGAMKSPVFGFTLEDLYEIRSVGGGEGLFSSLRSYAQKKSDPRVRELLSFITEYRRRAKEWPVDRLVYSIMEERGLTALLCMGQSEANASEIRDNLFYFYDLVRALSSDAAGDIGRVLERISDMAASDEAGEGKMTLPVKGHVRMMTIHGSKGLQFKVCWLYGMASGIDSSSAGMFSAEFGPAFRIKDGDYPIFRRRSENGEANRLFERKKRMNEYVRLLYVALTRTIKRLYISGKITKALNEFLPALSTFDGDLYPIADRSRTGLALLLLGLGGREDLCRIVKNEYPAELAAKDGGEGGKEKTTAPDAEVVEYLKAEYQARRAFTYKYAAACDLPAKKAVSKLCPTMLDEQGEDLDEAFFDLSAADGQEDPDAPGAPLPLMRPAFIRRREGEKDIASAAQKGSATHAFMQFCNFENLEEKGFEEEGRRLVDEKFLDKPTLDLVEVDAVKRFLASDLFKRLKAAGSANKLLREQRFMIALPASGFTSDEKKKEQLAGEELLVQGVIDGLFIDENDKVVLFDYKTDHFTPAQMKRPDDCRAILKKRHGEQLSYYKDAVKRMLGREVDETIIYSFAVGEVKL